jgi:hypothetical protein
MAWLSSLFDKPKTTLDFPVEFDEGDRRIVGRVIARKLSMTSRERLFATLLACRHVASADIAGDFVECGVWRGGNALIAADVFARLSKPATVHLFDTFAGMTEPTEHDVANADGASARDRYAKDARGTHNAWCYASLEGVQNNFREAGLLNDAVRFVQGDVLQTLADKDNLPSRISVLRLDTDWYESTKAELEILWPLLQPGGILMVDDYGHWGGAKKAVDEFFEGKAKPFFHYIDYTGRLAVKA